jgi:GntR family transcriptional regulator, rspAB operon transcriptional repressor
LSRELASSAKGLPSLKSSLKNTTDRLSERAYRHTLKQILDRELSPGDWIDRNELAKQLGVSLAPVADAISRLTNEGFLIAVHRRGTQVRTPKASEIVDQLLLRMALECQVARICSGEFLKPFAKELKKIAQQADSPQADATAAWRADLAFHQELVSLANCPVITRCFTQMMQLTLFQYSGLVTPYPLNMRDCHVALLADLLEATPEQAAERMRQHIRIGKEYLLGDLRV